MTFESGTALLHYRLLAKIGEGGLGGVWAALATTRDGEEVQNVRSLRLDEHVASEECWLHTDDFCLSKEELG